MMTAMKAPRGRKHRKRFHKRVPAGASPGTLIADPEAPRPRMKVIAYGPSGVVEREIDDPESVRPLLASHPVVWLNVDGLGDADTILAVGKVFGLHRLALEDVINVTQRPKLENYGEHQFLVARMIEWVDHLETDQLSLFLGRNFVVTFQEKVGDPFDPVRARICGGKGSIRSRGPDYLAYALIDATIDEYFPVLEKCGERLEMLEDRILVAPSREDIPDVHEIKHDLLTLRRAVWPMRETLSLLLRDSESLVEKETRLYLNDCYDHTVQIMDLVETYREIASSLVEMYLSSLSNRLNEVMKVLTMIATIFIPLTFIVGVYGMNFDPDASPWNMPELRWKYGYVACLLFMVAVTAGLLVYFRRRGWLGQTARMRRNALALQPVPDRPPPVAR
jgi:magnesium transporter